MPFNLMPFNENDEELCPNCVTPWKCNGPHWLRAGKRPEDLRLYGWYLDVDGGPRVYRSQWRVSIITSSGMRVSLKPFDGDLDAAAEFLVEHDIESDIREQEVMRRAIEGVLILGDDGNPTQEFMDFLRSAQR